METRRLRAGAVLLLAVAALGAAGAAVDSSGGGRGSSGAGGGSSSGSGGEGSVGILLDPADSEPLIPPDLLPMLIGIMAIGGMVAAVVAFVLALIKWDLEDFIAFVRTKAGKGATALLCFAAMYFLFQFFEFGGGAGSMGGAESSSEGVSNTASETGIDLSIAAGFAIVVVIVVLLIFVARSTEDDEEDDGGGTAHAASDSQDAAVGSGGSSLGGANVGRPPADNEVYRAWLSLANEANANARQETPEEVADRAVDAGVDEAAAREITSLFESVRYGDREPTSGIEQRAERARAKLAGER